MELVLQKKISEIVGEYEIKYRLLDKELESFMSAADDLKSSACVSGTWGNVSIDTGHIHKSTLEASLLKSAWRHVYNGLQIERIATASDKKLFEQAMENPPDFTLENIRSTFGDYILNPMGNILRGLAEVFCDLDQAYRSHDKVRIGVKGLPKRIIISNVGSYGWGRDKITDVINALAAYQGKPLVSYCEISALLHDEEALLRDGEIEIGSKYQQEKMKVVGRGVRLRRFANGNGHLFFEAPELKDINRALSEYYGEVLADCHEEKPEKRQGSTSVSKDLQYYPTPCHVVERVLSDLYIEKGSKVLEPSCGCGRFMDAIRNEGANVFGIEVDPQRAHECRKKGHNVLIANFLETAPTAEYDRVIMNPPFYGKHYAKHVNHALKFLKDDGVLTAILPITARYDHGLLDGEWRDLPVGSFSESGTNINTTVLTVRK